MSIFEKFECPDCGAECRRDEVDVGVGYVCGPWVCTNPDCGWIEYDPYADLFAFQDD
jgi:predicted RNA-binding Zn-ribbon protein involved in translation (DUF1610 family)